VFGQVVSIDSVSATNPSCNNADGSILIHASGGNTALIYSINSGTEQTDSSFASLASGVYQIVVKDSIGFFDTLTYTLYGSGGLSVDAVNVIDVTCFGLSNGEIDIQISGGTGAYSFNMQGGGLSQTTGVFSGLPADNYTIYVIDGAFCTDTVFATITEPLELDFTTTTTDATCPVSDGGFVMNATGGDNSYLYSMDGGSNYVPSGVFSGLSAGIYIGVVIDGTGCTDTASVFVNSAPGSGPDILTLNFINPLCNDSNNGSITLFAIGSGSIDYSIDGGGTFQNTNTFTNLAPGSYDIFVQDVNGCSTGSTINITEPEPLVTELTVVNETCVGSNGQIVFNTSGGTQPYSYSTNGMPFVSASTVNNLTGGSYDYIVMDFNGCTDTGTVVLESNQGPTILNITTVEPTCPLDSNGSIVLDAITQSGPIQYSIDNGNTVFALDSFPNLPSGTYDIVLTDGDGCVTSSSVVLSGPPAPVADFTANPISGFAPLDVSFIDNSVGATSYLWDFGDGSTATTPNPNHTYTSNGIFMAVQTVSNGACTDTLSIKIIVEGEPSISVPNVFTPNGDGFNDLFSPDAIGILSLNGKIYNRYGAMVYEWDGPEGAWDGFTSPAGVRVSDGTYFYVIVARGFNGEDIQKKGFVTVVRETPLKR